ncbi:hypothetical protein [Enterovibrio baiacu]|uniref:hypothetical protein n=1 Tax=Enterovibrio baiacu TaxID=2491023 RepID=UPI00142DFB25|nr:hypothetical protein [Enterovibrio baiacu]
MSYSPNRNKVILQSIVQFFVLAVLVSLPILIVRTDVLILKNGLSERSLTEYSEQILLAATVYCYLFVAYAQPACRRFMALVSGFFAVLLIRELDLFFDEAISHGFWVYPATFVAASALIYALSNREETMKGFNAFVSHKEFPLLSFGLVLLLVFSRLFGMGSLWEDALGDGYVRVVKNMVEEGTELMAYFIILYSSARYVLSIHRTQRELPQGARPCEQ